MEAIVNGIVFDGERELGEKAVLIEDSLVVGLIDSSEVPTGVSTYDAKGGWVVPGFLDLQVNGGGGVLFNEDPSLETIRRIAASHRRFGTVALLPTLISDGYDKMAAAADAARAAVQAGIPGVLGIHFEGPFLSKQKPGVHDRRHFCSLDDRSVHLLTSLKDLRVLVTLAPEVNSPDYVSELLDHGVIVSIGHTAASYRECQAALHLGVTGFTHLYNAMSPMTSREPGAVGAAITLNESWFGIIADGHHCHPASFKVAVRAKRQGGAVLVTDAMPIVGTENSRFTLGGEVVNLVDGRCLTTDGNLAGSALDMMSAVNNAAEFADIDWYEAVRMASLYPATALGLSSSYGAVTVGASANIVAINQQREVVASWSEGIRYENAWEVPSWK